MEARREPNGVDTVVSGRLYEACMALLERYALPEGIVRHSVKVAEVARFIAERLVARGERVDIPSLVAGALLHDVGKSAAYKRLRARNHAEASAEIIVREGLPPVVARIAERHILDSVLSPASYPSTWEEKVVFYADKVVTQRLVSLHERFSDLRSRRPDIEDLLEASLGPTKALESELLAAAGITWADIAVHLDSRGSSEDA